jgi:hypothetical protein
VRGQKEREDNCHPEGAGRPKDLSDSEEILRHAQDNTRLEAPLTSHVSPLSFLKGAISRKPIRGATWLLILTASAILACRGRQPSVPAPENPATPTAPRTLPLARVFVLETSGPPPSDTSVTFTTGIPRVIILYHSGESITFARLSFEPSAFGDSGRSVQVDIHPRPGIYGLDVTTSLPLRGGAASVTFEYSRYFSAPARARQVYGSDVAFERVLAVGRLLPDNEVELLPTTRPAADDLQAALSAPGSYLAGGPQ